MLHEIKIRAVLNGYIAIVGCQTLVFNSRPEMLKELNAYLDKPVETEKRYRKNAINAQLLNTAPQATEPANTCTMTVGYPTAIPTATAR